MITRYGCIELFGWKSSGFPGFHTSLHVRHIGEAHFFEKLASSGGVLPRLARNHTLARAILDPRLTPNWLDDMAAQSVFAKQPRRVTWPK